MTAIRIKSFGGLSPSRDPRNLDDDGAQVAQNVDLRFDDFRPSRGLGASVATVPAGTQSIFRTPSGVWLTSTNDVDYVNGQINDAASERVYLTGRSAYPEAWQGGVYRRLGVPAPTTKPDTTVVVVDEFDQGDATNAQEEATVAVLNAIKAIDTDTLLGNAASGTAGTPGAFDSLYPKVQLHLKFDTYPSGNFVDSSPQKRVITAEAGVAFLNDNTGPLGAPGAGCANLTGGAGVGGITFSQITRLGTESDRTWTVDMHLTPAETCPELIIESWKGAGDDFANPNMRKLAFIKADGSFRTVMSNINGSFSTALRCKRADGSDVLVAGVPVHISLQNNGTVVEVFVDGVKAGQTPFPLGLEFSHFGRATNFGNEAFLGKVDELRVTFAARYTGNFAKPTTPYPTLAVPTGFFLGHGTAGYSSMPTSHGGEAVYMVELAASGGGYVAADPASEYLRLMTGSQVTGPGGAQYWAVLVPGFRARGLTATEANIETAIAGVDLPGSPGTPLLTAPQVAALGPLLEDVYDPTVAPLLQLVGAVNSAQAALQAQLAVTPGNSAEVTTKINLLTSASQAVEAYFAGLDNELREVLRENESTVFGAIASSVVTRDIETRGYIVTFVTDWGEESAPSPVSDLLELDQNDHVQIVAPSPTAGRNIVGWRLYRSSTTDRSAAFQLVVDAEATNAVLQDGAFAYFGIGNLSFLDTKKQQELQEPCATLTWAEPPAALKGLVGLPNGMMAGFFDKTLCFCEPYAPYAWPVEYQQTVKFKVVGLGVFGQTLVVLTEGHPYFASGADSASVSLQEVEVPQACVAKRSIASSEGGVIYASPDGLCLASARGVEVLTYAAFSKDDWQALVAGGALGAFSDGSYYLFT